LAAVSRGDSPLRRCRKCVVFIAWEADCPLFETAACQTGGLRRAPPIKARTARTMKMKKKIFATSYDILATRPKPKKAAIKAITRKTKAKRNMSCSLQSEVTNDAQHTVLRLYPSDA